jgi:hypothetical protein
LSTATTWSKSAATGLTQRAVIGTRAVLFARPATTVSFDGARGASVPAPGVDGGTATVRAAPAGRGTGRASGRRLATVTASVAVAVWPALSVTTLQTS